ncbi:MAG: 4'-phosphopantetheinyl transferase superfamily protein [Firmicutes bacterium]|nr:4'-phosphopantetheinyl transferase superfamily protein [Bacillota bacterium]MCM1400379.1 4'-phosphopantetheinyl transferase superfamily protein [Bacteroides sp.]MCM1477136.1 4'-phosphopantetheinyl transferase superfamily protein [Bacteroides sp.]
MIETICGECKVSLFYAPVSHGNGRTRREGELRTERALLDEAFGAGVELGHDAYGAPFVKGFAGSVSLSHCEGLCVLAVCRSNDVGVDVERWREQLRRIAPRFLLPTEMVRCGSEPDNLLKCWTAKEAVFKAAGVPGLAIGEIAVDLQQSEALLKSGRKFNVKFLGEFPLITAVAIEKPE